MTILNSNKSIIELGKKVGGNALEFLSAGARASASEYKKMGADVGIKGAATAIGKGHMKKGADLALENVDMKKIAGSYMAASGAYRIASGGGVYKDRHGNTDVIGLPLI